MRKCCKNKGEGRMAAPPSNKEEEARARKKTARVVHARVRGVVHARARVWVSYRRFVRRNAWGKSGWAALMMGLSPSNYPQTKNPKSGKMEQAKQLKPL
jgi:hypothetical protein